MAAKDSYTRIPLFALCASLYNRSIVCFSELQLPAAASAAPQAAALRELEEEIGYTADLELLYDFYSAIGFCNERIKLYAATNLKKVENPRPQDSDETLELLEVTLKEAKDLIQTGEICDAKTIMAIQYWDLINK